MAILLAVAALMLMMSLLQAQMLFPTHAVAQAGPLRPGAHALNVATAEGDQLHGVHFPPTAATSGPRTLVLGFGGNAWNGQHVAEILADIFPEADVVAFHYRGYRPSTGSPSAQALKEDAPLLFDHAVDRVKPDKVVAVGFSIGSGVAASLSRHRGVDGVVLVTPFDSLKRVAGDLFPWLPIGPLFQHELAASDDLRQSATPVAIVAAEHDDIVRPRRTEALRRGLATLVYDRTIEGAGHNDIYRRAEFERSMREAYRAIIASKK